ncbi:hypothetical protein BC828DRAFT_394490, partial [Blastocladiella britannica]
MATPPAFHLVPPPIQEDDTNPSVAAPLLSSSSYAPGLPSARHRQPGNHLHNSSISSLAGMFPGGAGAAAAAAAASAGAPSSSPASSAPPSPAVNGGLARNASMSNFAALKYPPVSPAVGLGHTPPPLSSSSSSSTLGSLPTDFALRPYASSTSTSSSAGGGSGGGSNALSAQPPHPALSRLASGRSSATPPMLSVLAAKVGSGVPRRWRVPSMLALALLVAVIVVHRASRPHAAGGYVPVVRKGVPGDTFPYASSLLPAPAATSKDLHGNAADAAALRAPIAVTDNVVYAHAPAVDNVWGFVDREPGSFEPMVIGQPAPRRTPLPRKHGLIAIAAGQKAKPTVDKLVRRFGLHDFGFMLFHWDNATWHEFDWYKDIISVRSLGQTKFWFAKRYLTPDVVQNYDYIWLWDDDIVPEPEFDAVGFTKILKDYHVHFAQPALTWGEHGLQGAVVRKREGSPIGRFTSFVEIMLPVVSRGAWPCAWRMIPWDARATWGVDNA